MPPQPDNPAPADRAFTSAREAARLLALDPWAGRVVHTPCSTIYLDAPGPIAGGAGLAYKIRKPVNLGYLDFSTPERRRHFGEEEVRLNSELAPGVYRRVVPVVRLPDGRAAIDLLAGESTGAAKGVQIDTAVEMRQLPEAGMLPALLAARPLSEPERTAIVGRLAEFHAKCPRGAEISKHATPEEIGREFMTNLEEASRLKVLSPGLLGLLHSWFVQELDVLRPRLAARANAGRVCEAHGDLHAGNICFDPAAITTDNPTGLVIYDRLEFRLDYRCIDVAAELACLASTLDAHGRPEDADALVAEYAQATGDAELRVLQPLYRAHYAAVRAKVHAMRAAQPDCAPAERAAHENAARNRLVQAAAYAIPPVLVLTCGLPGSGKSFASRALAGGLRIPIARADEIRKGLAGLAPTERGGPELYTPEMSIRTYDTVLHRCEAWLHAGHGAIADATFRSRELREPFLILGRSMGVKVVIVYCRADEEVTERRLAARTASGADASDADLAVYRKLKGAFEAPSPAEAPVVEMAPTISTAAMLERLILSIGHA